MSGGQRGRRGMGPFGLGPDFPFGQFGPFGPPGWGPPFAPGWRAGRGDVREAILLLLDEQPRNGYQLIQELAERTGGVWRPSSGSVYPALQQLEDEGLVHAEERDGRRVFLLTEAGQAEVRARGDDRAPPWEAVAEAVDDESMEMRQTFRQVAVAFFQVMNVGSDAQIARARKVLTDARRSLYQILAEDDTERDDGAPDAPSS